MDDFNIWNVAYCFLRPYTVIVIGSLISLGYILKSIHFIRNEYITLFLVLAGIGMAATAPTSSLFEGVVLGITYAAVAVASYEMLVWYLIELAKAGFRFLWKKITGSEPPNPPFPQDPTIK
jgi:hypothetical protein